MSEPRAGRDFKSHSHSPPESGPERHARDIIKLRPLRPDSTTQSDDQLPRLSTLELLTQVTPKTLLQGQLKGADQGYKSRINSPREPDLDRHHRDRIGLAFMQPARKPQPGRQLPSIGKLQLPSYTAPENLLQGQQQGAGSSGPYEGQSERDREKAPEQPYQPAYKNRKPAERYPSTNAAPPRHKYDVPCGPAGIPNSHSEISRGQSKRNREELAYAN